ncbi:MAG TPA: hypothetical protein VGM83_03830 [Devosiaceae bacterium]|jgi:hypothetical protein
MHTAYFYASLLVVVCSLAWTLGTQLSRDTAFSFAHASLGVALTPSFIAIVTYAWFALTSYAMPSRILAAAVPPVLALGIAGSVTLWGKKPHWRSREFLPGIVVLGLIVALVPTMLAVRIAAIIGQSNHDISLYLLQASDISRMLRDGTSDWLAWARYVHPGISTPHSLSFQVYLAWGFLFADNPGFGSDYAPRLLVGLNHLALLAAVFGLTGRRHVYWGCLAVAVILFDSIWSAEIRGLSRDSFYIAPALVVLTLLLQSKPVSAVRANPVAGVALSLALIGALMGHSLGSLFTGSIAVGAGLVLMINYRQQVFYIRALWLTAAGLSIAAGVIVFNYLTISPGEQGFAYPFYVDPFQKLYFAARPFVSTPSPVQLLIGLCHSNGIHPALLAFPVVAGVMLLTQIRLGRSTDGAGQWLALLCSVLVMLLIIGLLPLKLDGVSLSGAFLANFRYGFAVGILLLALLAQSVTVVVMVEAIQSSLHSAWANRLRRVGLPVLLAATLVPAFGIGLQLRTTMIKANSSLAQGQRELCDQLKSAGVRTILLDNDGVIYRCATDTLYAFTAGGAGITGAEGEAAIAAALEAGKIDAVMLFTQIPALWSGTRLYQYLEANWQHVPIKTPATFLRPGLTLPSGH